MGHWTNSCRPPAVMKGHVYLKRPSWLGKNTSQDVERGLTLSPNTNTNTIHNPILPHPSYCTCTLAKGTVLVSPSPCTHIFWMYPVWPDLVMLITFGNFLLTWRISRHNGGYILKILHLAIGSFPAGGFRRQLALSDTTAYCTKHKSPALLPLEMLIK